MPRQVLLTLLPNKIVNGLAANSFYFDLGVTSTMIDYSISYSDGSGMITNEMEPKGIWVDVFQARTITKITPTTYTTTAQRKIRHVIQK
jgi:hypothetical protein